MRAALSLVFILGLTACSGTFTNPGAMPSGYSHYGNTYNARPGPEVSEATKAKYKAEAECEKECASGICSKTMSEDDGGIKGDAE